MDDEFAAAIDAVAAHFDVAVVHFDQSMNQRETETKSAFGARERADDLIKSFKQMGQIFSGNSNARVFNADDDRIACLFDV